MSSPWGKIEQVETTSFAEIMSEQYARKLEGKKTDKFKDELHQDLVDKSSHIIKSPPKNSSGSSRGKLKSDSIPSIQTGFLEVIPDEVLKVLREDEAATGIHDADALIAQALQEQFNRECRKENANEQVIDSEQEELPQPSGSTTSDNHIGAENVLKELQEDEEFAKMLDSDELIAVALQAEFDQEYNEELKRIEKHRNKNSKVSISLEKYIRDDFTKINGDQDEYDDDDDDDFDNQKGKDWDRFETNEKIFDAIPKCGFRISKDAGKTITKHDEHICGVRNACRIMSFPPEFHTGDGAGFDMKLSNAVFNQLKTYSKKMKKIKMYDRKENLATAEMGVDVRTRLILYKLIRQQILEQINGIISTGKEALILHANSDPSYEGELILPKECAIKIFKTTLNEFKQRYRYIKDDYRFKDRFSNNLSNAVIINMWAEKEMHNLRRMKKCGIKCPDVLLLKKHILVMSFIGHNHNPASKLKEARLTETELSLAYEEIIKTMHTLYNEANLIHADLSEYNILWYEGQCWFIDVAQSVEPSHPNALEFLMRDCDNIISFFTKRGLSNIYTKEELFEHITSLDIKKHTVATLEKIHAICSTDKPSSYSFDLAWEKSMEGKSRQSSSSSSSNLEETNVENLKTEPPSNVIHETADALQVLSIQKPVEIVGCESAAN